MKKQDLKYFKWVLETVPYEIEKALNAKIVNYTTLLVTLLSRSMMEAIA